MCSRCDYPGLLGLSNLAVTPGRMIVLRIIGSSASPLTHQEIYRTANRTHPMNRVTVYRILDVLVERGLVERLSSGDRSFRYGLAPNANHPRHAHFYCRNCGDMECLDPGIVKLDLQPVEKVLPVVIQKVEIRLDGICRNCLKKRE